MTFPEWYDDADPPMPTIPLQDEDIMIPWSELKKGHRVRWKTANFVKRGTVRGKSGRSLIVDFDAHDVPTVIPDGKWYAVEYSNGNMLEHLTAISTPAPEQSAAVQKLENPDKYVSPREAASILGTDPKNIRRMIRTGRLQSERIGGRWVIPRSSLNV